MLLISSREPRHDDAGIFPCLLQYAAAAVDGCVKKVSGPTADP